MTFTAKLNENSVQPAQLDARPGLDGWSEVPCFKRCLQSNITNIMIQIYISLTNHFTIKNIVQIKLTWWAACVPNLLESSRLVYNVYQKKNATTLSRLLHVKKKCNCVHHRHPKRPGFMPKKSSVLCTLHFNKNDIKLTPRKISHRRENRWLDPVTLDDRLSQAGTQIILINVSVYRWISVRWMSKNCHQFKRIFLGPDVK